MQIKIPFLENYEISTLRDVLFGGLPRKNAVLKFNGVDKWSPSKLKLLDISGDSNLTEDFTIEENDSVIVNDLDVSVHKLRVLGRLKIL